MIEAMNELATIIADSRDLIDYKPERGLSHDLSSRCDPPPASPPPRLDRSPGLPVVAASPYQARRAGTTAPIGMWGTKSKLFNKTGPGSSL
jgi:hypothetical protein